MRQSAGFDIPNLVKLTIVFFIRCKKLYLHDVLKRFTCSWTGFLDFQAFALRDTKYAQVKQVLRKAELVKHAFVS